MRYWSVKPQGLETLALPFILHKVKEIYFWQTYPRNGSVGKVRTPKTFRRAGTFARQVSALSLK